MRLSLTSGQIICIFCIAIFMSSCISGVFAYDGKISTCCGNVTTTEVKNSVQRCGHVAGRRKGRAYCHEAYVLFTEAKVHCINVTAPWINETLEKLKQDGNPCKGTPQ